MTLQAQQPKKKTDTLDFIKIKNFCASKDTIKKIKRSLTEWEEIFAITYLVKVQYTVCKKTTNNSTL